MSFHDIVENVGKTVDGVGVFVIATGVLYYTATAARQRGAKTGDRYTTYRQGIGRVILLGLEFLVAGDIIRTVAVSPTFRSAGILAIIVAIRTFLSFTLEVELNGRWPWQRLPITSPSQHSAR
ncbi:MAG: DUF1622 domain-containing protein [Actinomycetota bacterium]